MMYSIYLNGSKVVFTSVFVSTNEFGVDTYQCIFSYKKSSPICFDYYVEKGGTNDIIKAFGDFLDDVIDTMNGTEEIDEVQKLRGELFKVVFGEKDALEKAIRLQNRINDKCFVALR